MQRIYEWLMSPYNGDIIPEEALHDPPCRILRLENDGGVFATFSNWETMMDKIDECIESITDIQELKSPYDWVGTFTAMLVETPTSTTYITPLICPCCVMRN